jgi:ribulose-phosphate 3-epimerase
MIVPAIIPKNFQSLEEEVSKIKELASLVQVDVCDGVFTKNKTWPFIGDFGEFDKLAKEEIGLPFFDDIDYEFHLMIDKPELSVEKWIALGASSIVFHIEATENSDDIIQILRSREVSVGIAIKPSTPNEKIEKFIPKIDFIQIMGSDKIGAHGESLQDSAIEKIKYFKNNFPDSVIAIDIGVNEETIRELEDAGASKFVSGSSFLKLI